jgi:predicted phage terminase large subunit-like protein
MEPALADWIAANPEAAWRALDCADAKDSLHSFCGLIEIPGAPVEDDKDEDQAFQPIETPQALHHKLLLDKLEAVERGEIKRLMVFMPPGSAKSTYASVVFPAWFMGRKRRRNIIVATYASDLARKIGRRMRSIVKQPVYREIFGTGLADDQKAADEWALDNGNEFMGGGILSGITGNRADGLLIDDPVKGRQDADSETIQSRTKAEYDDSLKTRLKPGGWIVIIQTRWNENDLAGSILPENYDGESGAILCRDGQVWEVICIPAQAERADDPLGRKPGEMLWKEWFDEAHWDTFRSNPRTWSALFQQRPAPGDGTFFKREWFRRYRPGQEPTHLKRYLVTDHAPTDGPDSDPNAGRIFGLDEVKNVYILDGYNRVQQMDKTADCVLSLIKRHKPFAWFPEDDNNFKTAAPFIRQRMRAEGLRTRIEPIKPHGQDKATKAQSIQGMAAMGQVFIPEGPEGDAIIDQLVKFPAGKHDEEVDILGIMGRVIDMAHPALVPSEEPAPAEPKGINQMTFDQLMAAQKPRVDRV